MNEATGVRRVAPALELIQHPLAKTGHIPLFFVMSWIIARSC
jgi:hypothetical protein